MAQYLGVRVALLLQFRALKPYHFHDLARGGQHRISNVGRPVRRELDAVVRVNDSNQIGWQFDTRRRGHDKECAIAAERADK